MSYANRAGFEPIKEIDFGDVPGSGEYTKVGTPTTKYARICYLNNFLDQEVYVSLNGITDHMRMPINSMMAIDVSTNNMSSEKFCFEKTTQFYIRRSSVSVSSGSFWIEIVGGEGGI